VPFETYEESRESSQPVELYVFTVNGGFLRYTSDAEDVDIASTIFTATALERSEIEEVADIAKNQLTLTAPTTFAVSELFAEAPPDEVVGLTVYRTQRGDPSDTQTIWKGRVLNVSWQKDHSEITCEGIFTSLKRPGLRRLYGRNCPHVLYGAECRADPLTFRQTAVLDSVDGINITSADFAAFADNHFAGGKIEWIDTDGNTRRRGIKTHVGNAITVTHPISALSNGNSVFVYPGCDHTIETCLAKFANEINYGGFVTMGGKNPFGSSSVF